METLEARLQSRFEWGLIADISSPDYETRMAILRKKEELDGYNIDDEVIRYIATNIKSNIRELEGALNKLVALSNLEKREITISMAEEVLKDIISPNSKREVTPQVILEVVAEHYGVSSNDIIGGKRNSEIVVPDRSSCISAGKSQIPLIRPSAFCLETVIIPRLSVVTTRSVTSWLPVIHP